MQASVQWGSYLLTGDEIDMQGLDEDVFRAEESLESISAARARNRRGRRTPEAADMSAYISPRNQPELRAAND